jgi:hypothetical protein
MPAQEFRCRRMSDHDHDIEQARERRAALARALASPCFRPPRKPRKPTLKAALAEADKAGRPVRGAVIAPSGEFTLQFGEPEKPTNNPLDKWMAKHNAN